MTSRTKARKRQDRKATPKCQSDRVFNRRLAAIRQEAWRNWRYLLRAFGLNERTRDVALKFKRLPQGHQRRIEGLIDNLLEPRRTNKRAKLVPLPVATLKGLSHA